MSDMDNYARFLSFNNSTGGRVSVRVGAIIAVVQRADFSELLVSGGVTYLVTGTVEDNLKNIDLCERGHQ